MLVTSGWLSEPRGEAPVGVKELAADPAAFVREQERGDAGDVLRGAGSAQWVVRGQHCSCLVVHPAGVDRARVHDIGRNALRAELARSGDDDPIQGALGCAVGEIAGCVELQGNWWTSCFWGDKLSVVEVSRLLMVDSMRVRLD